MGSMVLGDFSVSIRIGTPAYGVLSEFLDAQVAVKFQARRAAIFMQRNNGLFDGIRISQVFHRPAVFSISRRHGKFFGFSRFSKGLPYDRHEFVGIYRLFKEGLCAGLHGAHPVILSVSPGDDDDGDGG
jgi:hypothetical protein